MTPLPDKIALLLTGDNNVWEGICLNVLSVLKYTPRPVKLYVMTMNYQTTVGISRENAEKLRTVMQERDHRNELVWIDVTKDYEEDFASSPNKKAVYSPASLIRLFAYRYIAESTVIYLDADTMTLQSLERFYDFDMQDKELGVVVDYLGKTWIGKNYFNSGVLFIQMDNCKKSRLFERCIKILNDHKFYFADQTALNKCCPLEKRVYLPEGFNAQRDITPQTVVKHFLQGIKWVPFQVYNVKQWQREKVHSFLHIHQFDDIYAEYDQLF